MRLRGWVSASVDQTTVLVGVPSNRVKCDYSRLGLEKVFDKALSHTRAHTQDDFFKIFFSSPPSSVTRADRPHREAPKPSNRNYPRSTETQSVIRRGAKEHAATQQSSRQECLGLSATNTLVSCRNTDRSCLLKAGFPLRSRGLQKV